MDWFFYGTAWLFEQLFKVLPSVLQFVDLLFVAILMFGSLYWVYYEYHVKTGKSNYLAEHVKEETVK
jgi:hypothetical protein